MRSSPKKRDAPQVPPNTTSTVILLTIADTTWRMFVPSLGLTFFGLWLDSKWQTTPWAMLVGVIVGLTVAALAVRIQYKKISSL